MQASLIINSAKAYYSDVCTGRRLQHRRAVAGARLWNSLPHDIVASDTLSQFRCGLKTFLFRRSYTSILF